MSAFDNAKDLSQKDFDKTREGAVQEKGANLEDLEKKD